jgi:hypothetical protein
LQQADGSEQATAAHGSSMRRPTEPPQHFAAGCAAAADWWARAGSGWNGGS